MSTFANLALICDIGNQQYITDSLAQLPEIGNVLLVSDKPKKFSAMQGVECVSFADAALDRVPISWPKVQESLQSIVRLKAGEGLLLIDMSWGVGTVSATANFDQWGSLCDYLVESTQLNCVSLYNRGMQIENHLLAALRGHFQFLSPTGIHENPFWLPSYLQKSSLSQQVDFLLGRVIPDYEAPIDDGHLSYAATGASPGWLINQGRGEAVGDRDERWKIRCFGSLRIYKSDGEQINWQIPGSATKKTKTLFAYLLQRGQRGASAEHMAELLWPLEDDEEAKRNRLHHCIAMLRKTLGHNDYVKRNGDYYHLLPPAGSWIDVANFEQLCRQAKVLAKTGKHIDAVEMLQVADQLYTGKLFEDLPVDYVESETEDWCLAQRMWFREMAIKVQRDMAELLREQGDYREALACCNKAISMDPLSEMAHAEAMKIYCEQARFDAAERQFRQYKEALKTNGVSQVGKNINMLMDKITRENNEI